MLSDQLVQTVARQEIATDPEQPVDTTASEAVVDTVVSEQTGKFLTTYIFDILLQVRLKCQNKKKRRRSLTGGAYICADGCTRILKFAKIVTYYSLKLV